jgi:hypothetical protein
VARPVHPAPSRRVMATMAAVAVVAIVAAIVSFGDGRVPPASASPSSASPTVNAGSSADTSPSPTSSATPAQSDATAGVARWTAVSPATPGPDARSGHTWTADPSSAVAYLFGGRGSAGPLGDGWAYDLTADRWSQLQPDGERPAARFEHGAAWIDGLGLVVFGGRNESRVLDDFWAFDPSANAWRALEISGAGPSARAAACLALRADGQLWLYGGQRADGTASAELWVYDPGPSSWMERAAGDGPEARAGMACWWSADGRLVVHGGRTSASSAPVGDLWAYDPDAGADGAWQDMEATGLVPRDRAAATTTSHGGVVAGGIGADDAPLADVVVFDDQSLAATVLRPAPDGPTPRSGAALADDPEGERTLMYGGLGADGPLGDLWALDLP